MRWRIVSVGKPRLAFARDGITEYLARLRCFAQVEVVTVKASTPAKEGRQLLEATASCHRIILDERGRTFTSRQWADEMTRLERDARRTCAIIVGGADGHVDEVRAAADLLWSLTPLTLQHEMALLVALEQLYRGCTIRAGLPYHRE